MFLLTVAGHDFPLLPRFCLCHGWASGLEAIHLLGFALGSCSTQRQKPKHHSCVTFKSLSDLCHLYVTYMSLAGNFEGALKLSHWPDSDFAKKRQLFVGIIPFCNPDTPNFHGHSHYLVGGLEHYLFFHILGIIIQRGSNHQPVIYSHGEGPWCAKVPHEIRVDGKAIACGNYNFVQGKDQRTKHFQPFSTKALGSWRLEMSSWCLLDVLTFLAFDILISFSNSVINSLNLCVQGDRVHFEHRRQLDRVLPSGHGMGSLVHDAARRCLGKIASCYWHRWVCLKIG